MRLLFNYKRAFPNRDVPGIINLWRQAHCHLESNPDVDGILAYLLWCCATGVFCYIYATELRATRVAGDYCHNKKHPSVIVAVVVRRLSVAIRSEVLARRLKMGLP